MPGVREDERVVLWGVCEESRTAEYYSSITVVLPRVGCVRFPRFVVDAFSHLEEAALGPR